MTRKIQQYVDSLFKHGLEKYDASLRHTSTKGVVNPGGAKVFMHPDFRSNASKVTFNHDGFGRAIKDANSAMLYALNSVELDDDNNPVLVNTVSGSMGYRRINTGLMLYLPAGKAEDTRDVIIEAVDNVDISDYIDTANNLDDPDGKLNVLKEFNYQNFARDLVPLELKNCLIMALPSGAPGSNQFWSFSNNRASSRQSMTDATSAPSSETDFII